MAPAGSPAVAPPAEAERRCLNCGVIPTGTYCQACGQRCREGRLTVRLIGRWVLSDLLNLDRGLFLTIREMTLRPSAMIRAYVGGQRRRYTNPFTYFFLCAGLSLLAWSALSDAMVPQIKASVLQSAQTMGGGFSPAQQARLTELQLALIPYSGQIGLLLCLPFAGLLRLFFRRTGHNFAEVFVFALFVSGQHYLVSSIATAAIFPLSHSYGLYTAITLVLYPAIYAQAGWGFFKRGFGTIVKVSLSIGIALLAYALAQVFLLHALVRLTVR